MKKSRVTVGMVFRLFAQVEKEAFEVTLTLFFCRIFVEYNTAIRYNGVILERRTNRMKTIFDPLAQKYGSQRYPIYARGGMVNSSSPQASAAGLEILRQGGNAVDAAVAAAAALTVVEPTANGIGSDAFAIVWSAKEQRLFGLNSSGPAPSLASIEQVLADGKDEDGNMPRLGWIPVTVPGAPKAWAELNSRFGRLALADDLAPAVKYAREGYPCAPNLAEAWKNALLYYRSTCTDPAFAGWFRTFAPEGRAYEAGDMIRLPDHAATLEPSGLRAPTPSIGAISRGGLTRRAENTAAIYAMRIWLPIRQNGSIPSASTIGVMMSARSRRTDRALWRSWR